MEDVRAYDTERRYTLVALASAQADSGAVDDARRTVVQAARLALDAGDVDTTCAALTLKSQASFAASDPPDPDKVALVRAALTMPSVSNAHRANLLSELSTELMFESDDSGRRSALNQLCAILPSLDAHDHARILQNTGMFVALLGRNRLEMLDSMFDEALSVACANENLWLRGNRFWLNFHLGRRDVLDESARTFEQSVVKARTRLQWISALTSTMTCVLDGDLDGADRDAHEMTRLLKVWAVPEAANYGTTTSNMINRERRTLGDLLWLAEVTEQMGAPSSAGRTLAAYIRFASGDIEGPTAALDLVRVDEITEDTSYGVVLALWSEIAAVIGTDEQRRSLAEVLQPLAGLHLATGGIYCGAADRLRALLLDRLGGHDQADALFADAVRQHEDFRSPTWVARTQLDWAESLLRRGSPDAASTHLDAAATALGNLDLPDNQFRLAELRSRLAAGPG